MARRPANRAAGEGIVSDQSRRVAFTARSVFNFEASTRYSSNGLEHFLHRGSISRSKVQDMTRAVFQEMLDRARVRVGKVKHMHEIANAGAVARVIVRSKNLKMRPTAERGIHCDRYGMRFRRMPFANPAFRISAGGVEIAQNEGAESLMAVEVSQYLFEDKLALTVGIERLLRMSFVHRSR